MTKPRLLQFLIKLGLEFWLPLPLIGLIFFVGTGWLTDQVLSYTYKTNIQLNAESQHQIHFSTSLAVMSIEAIINPSEKLTEVDVYTADSVLKQMEFEFPFTEFEEIETAIAQVLGLSQTAVKQLIRYRIDR
ncbi:hypothetical protein [Gloeothece citriformis]|nr:hypothetical protein [Gloeothece citriformis]